MPFLLIETSTEHTLAVIMEGKEIKFKEELPTGLNNSKYLAPTIQEGLKKLGLKVADLAYIAVGIGPGSYTGIRVGVMLAKTLAFAANIPLIGISTLKCFVPTYPGPFLALIDARIGGAYVAGGVKDEMGWVEYSLEPQVTSLDAVQELIKGKHWIVTPQAKILKPKLESFCADCEWQELAPDPFQMANLATSQFSQGEIALDGSLELMYLRKTQAEIEKEQFRKSL